MTSTIRLALPKGRMQEGVFRLLADAGLPVRTSARGYRPEIPLDGFETKILKPVAIVEMLHRGSRDLGFAGHDWVVERGADLVEVLDTELDPVRIVAAAPESLLDAHGQLPQGRPLVAASEYMSLTQRWVDAHGIEAHVVRSYGATEVLPPEDADLIVDNTATGATLRANGLRILEDLLHSSTRLYAHPAVMDDPTRRSRIEDLTVLLRSVLNARRRVMVELNCGADALEQVIRVLPCMREPTVSPLHASAGYAVKAAVMRDQLPALIPQLKAAGGGDIVVTNLSQIVP